jgi:hypothetical protein
VPGTSSNHTRNMDGNPEAGSESPPEATTLDNHSYEEASLGYPDDDSGLSRSQGLDSCFRDVGGIKRHVMIWAQTALLFSVIQLAIPGLFTTTHNRRIGACPDYSLTTRAPIKQHRVIP